jgi:hypothetical protein
MKLQNQLTHPQTQTSSLLSETASFVSRSKNEKGTCSFTKEKRERERKTKTNHPTNQPTKRTQTQKNKKNTEETLQSSLELATNCWKVKQSKLTDEGGKKKKIEQKKTDRHTHTHRKLLHCQALENSFQAHKNTHTHTHTHT